MAVFKIRSFALEAQGECKGLPRPLFPLPHFRHPTAARVKIFSGDWLMRANDAPIWLKLDINFDQGWLLLLGFSGKHSWWWWQKTWEWFLFLVSRIPCLSPFNRHDDLLKLHDSLPAWQSWETLQRCGNASWRLVYVHRRWVQLHITVATSAFFEKSVAEKDGTLVAVSTGDNKKETKATLALQSETTMPRTTGSDFTMNVLPCVVLGIMGAKRWSQTGTIWCPRLRYAITMYKGVSKPGII